MAIPCNMPEEERAEWLGLFDGFLSDEEDERARRLFTPYLFYDTWGRRDFREYRCPCCGGFEIERPRRDAYIHDPFQYHHGDAGPCPMCGTEAVHIALGRMGREMTSLREWRQIAVIRACRGALLISAGLATRRYDKYEDLYPAVDFDETRRYVVTPGKRMMWVRPSGSLFCFGREYWRNEREGWKVRKRFTEPFARTHYGLGGGLRPGEVYILGAESIEKSECRYCQLTEFVWDRWGVDLLWGDGEPCAPIRGAVTYLGEYSRRPQLEMLHKLGHDDLIEALLEKGSIDRRLTDWRAKDPAGFFRMTKAEYRVFREKNAKLEDLAAWRTDGNRTMGFEEHFAACAFLGGRAKEFFALCGERGLEEREALRYLRGQAPVGADGKETFGLWRDLLDMAAALGRDMTFKRNIYPEDLREEHDAAALLTARLREKEANRGYGQRFRRLKRRYAWTDGEYQITVPVSAKDIELEGKALRHCVAGYATRHITGATTILFLRACGAPKKRYVTIELREPDHIVQVRGYMNDRDKPEAARPAAVHAAFLEEWIAWVRAGSPRHKNGKPIRLKKRKEKTA